MESQSDPLTPTQELERLVERLSPLLDISRKGFLNIADQMGGFSGTFATGATRATSIHERIHSADAFGLGPLKNDLNKINREIGTALGSVATIMARKDHFVRDMEELIHWGLSVERDAFLPSVADQVKGRGGADLELQTLGSIIDNLMQQIRPLIHEVVSAGQESHELMNHLARRVVSDLESSEMGQVGLKKATSTSQRRMTGAIKRISTACTDMEERSRRVSGLVFQMVQAMQYDDITVQRLEHAVVALNRAQAKLATPDDPQAVRWFVIAVRIVVDQLEETMADLVTAVQSIHHHLREIAHLAEEQVEDIGQLRESAMHFRQDTADIRFGLGAFLRLSIFNDALSADVLRTLSMAENAVFQAKRGLNVLMMTSQRLKTLAISLRNQGGERLEILADSIIELAERVAREAPPRVAEVNGAAGALADINNDFSQKTTPRLMRTNSLLRRVPLSTQQLENNYSDLIGVMNTTLAETQAIAIQIMLLAGELNFHTHMKRVVHQVTQDLQVLLHRVGGEMASGMDRDAVHTLAQEFEDLAELYTMESERRVHNAALDQGEGNGDEPEDDGFELF